MELTLQWLGGFFDGEGWAGVAVGSKLASGKRNLHVRTSVTNTHLPTLKLIQGKFGGSLITVGKKGKGRTRACYALVWTCKKALAFLRTLQPYLVVKKGQVDLILAAWETRIVGKTARVTPEEYEQRAQLQFQLRELQRAEYLPSEVN